MLPEYIYAAVDDVEAAYAAMRALGLDHEESLKLVPFVLIYAERREGK